MSTSLHDYEQQARATDKASWLGALSYFHVSESNVEHVALAAHLTQADLEKYIPAKPLDANVFLRTFRNGQRKGGLTTDQGSEITENLLVRQVSRKEGRIVKRVVVETVDASGAQLGYEEKYEVEFNVSHPDHIAIRKLNGSHVEATLLVDRLCAEYHQDRGCVDANAVRMVIRDILNSTYPTTLRPGLYFVPSAHVDTLDRLEQVGAYLPGTTIHSIPLIDDDKQRNNLKVAFEAEVAEDADRIVAEISEIVRNREEITSARGAAYTKQIAEGRKKLDEYRALLQDNLSTAQMRMDMLQVKLNDLLRLATK